MFRLLFHVLLTWLLAANDCYLVAIRWMRARLEQQPLGPIVHGELEPPFVRCAGCAGTGWRDRSDSRVCATCGGFGAHVDKSGW